MIIKRACLVQCAPPAYHLNFPLISHRLHSDSGRHENPSFRFATKLSSTKGAKCLPVHITDTHRHNNNNKKTVKNIQISIVRNELHVFGFAISTHRVFSFYTHLIGCVSSFHSIFVSLTPQRTVLYRNFSLCQTKMINCHRTKSTPTL